MLFTSDRNMLVKNYNMQLKMFINVHLLVCHLSVQQFLKHGLGTH